MSTTPDADPSAGLNEEQRAAAFTQTYASRAEGGAPRVGPSRIPPKFVLVVALAFVVLGLGGSVLEHYYGNAGQGSPTPTTVVALPLVPVAPAGPQLGASTKALMGLKEIASAQAPSFTLTDQSHHSWSLADAVGKVVVLTFYNRDCTDICTVLGPEIRQAEGLLGVHAAAVDFIIVNADPNHFTYVANPLALTSSGLENFSNVRFLTGPLNQLNAVWINYGLSVRVGTLASQVAHNNVMYFITPRGDLHSLAVPFGNEDHSGAYSLDSVMQHRFAEGVANTAVSLAK